MTRAESRPAWLRSAGLGVIGKLPRAGFRASWVIASWLLGAPVLQRLLARNRVALFEHFLRETGLDATHTLANTVRQSLLEDTLLRARFKARTLRARSGQLQPDLEVENWQRVEAARQSGRGLLFALSHHGLPRLFIAWMRERGFAGVAVRMGVRARLQSSGAEATSPAAALLSARDLLTARRDLQAGGNAFILPDGKHGRDGTRTTLYGHERWVRSGFADLALTSGATVLPVDVVCGSAGSIRATIGEPLDPGSSSMPHEQRVELLARQYVDHLARIWARSPGSVHLSHVRRYLDAPVTATGEDTREALR